MPYKSIYIDMKIDIARWHLEYIFRKIKKYLCDGGLAVNSLTTTFRENNFSYEKE